jgi:Na+/H+-translocating membrane pyrophosphatase
MTTSKVKFGKAASIAGTVAIVAACIPCCIPLVAPILAWLGIATLGTAMSGWYLAGIAVFVLGSATAIYVRGRHRNCQSRPAKTSCDCSSSCKINV